MEQDNPTMGRINIKVDYKQWLADRAKQYAMIKSEWALLLKDFEEGINKNRPYTYTDKAGKEHKVEKMPIKRIAAKLAPFVEHTKDGKIKSLVNAYFIRNKCEKADDYGFMFNTLTKTEKC